MVTPALFGEKAGPKSRKTGMHRKKKGRKAGKAGQTESNDHSKFRILIALRNGGCSVRPFNASSLQCVAR